MNKVSVRGGFSDRNRIKAINTEIQLTDLDERTRIQLLNTVSALYSSIYDHDRGYMDEPIQDYIRFVLGSIYSQPVDPRHLYREKQVVNMIENTILNDDYDDVLTLVEALAQYWDNYLKQYRMNYYDGYHNRYNDKSVYEIINDCLKREYVGYRLVGGVISPISDNYEVSTINEGLMNRYQTVADHISKANLHLSDRKNPDYENSIKESISAVEAMCEIITNTSGAEASLGKMLKRLEDSGVTIHKALQSAFLTLYGYTSDSNGIRHAGNIGGPASTFEEAKFMLVACCAFVNYLTAVSARSEI